MSPSSIIRLFGPRTATFLAAAIAIAVAPVHAAGPHFVVDVAEDDQGEASELADEEALEAQAEAEDDATAPSLEAEPPPKRRMLGDGCRAGACVPDGTVEFTPKDLRRIRRVLPHIARASEEFGVDPVLISAIIWVESRYFPKAKSHAGAQGMMQLMPVTAQSLAKLLRCKPAVWNPRFSIRAGTLYVSRLLAAMNGDEVLALASYSRGLPRVKRWVARGRRTLPTITRGFVGKVQRAKAAFAAAYEDGTLQLPVRKRAEQPPSVATANEPPQTNVEANS